MKKLFVGLAAVCVLAGGVFAAGGDPSESGISTSPLKIWSTGVGGGLLYSLKSGHDAEACGKVMWLNSFDFTEGVALFADVDWYIVGNDLLNFGLDLGGDYSFLPFSRVSPFLGAGFGAHYFDIKVVEDFGGDTEMRGDFGGAVIVRAGVTLKLTNTVDVKVRVPFRYYVMNDYRDFGVGMEIGVLFFSRLRGVKSIDY